MGHAIFVRGFRSWFCPDIKRVVFTRPCIAFLRLSLNASVEQDTTNIVAIALLTTNTMSVAVATKLET